MPRLTVSLPTLAILIGVLLLAYVFGVQNSQSAAAFYATELARIGARENVSIGGKEYEVIQGVVYQLNEQVDAPEALALAYQKSLARRAPLLALPGVIPQELRESVDRLQTLRQQLSEVQASDTDKRSIQTALYPLQFLKIAATLEQTRLNFLASGSLSDAAAYDAVMRQALQAYGEDLERFHSAVVELVPTGPRYATLRTISDKASILKTLEDLRASLNETKWRFKQRLICMRGAPGACTESLELLAEGAAAPRALTGQEHALADTIVDAFKESGYRLSKGPLVLLSKSWCIPAEAPPLFAFTQRSSSESKTHVGPLFVGDVYFFKVGESAELPYLGYFAEHGIPYAFINPLSYYACHDSAHDLSKALATRDVWDYAISARVSRYAPAKAAEVARYEAQFDKADIVSEADALQYLRAATALATDATVPSVVAHDLIVLTLQMQSLGLGLYQTTLDIELYEQINRHLATRENPVSIDFSAKNILFVRSGFVQLFMSTPPLASSSYEQPTSAPYTSFSSFSQEPGAPQTLLKAINFDKTLHTR